jgi:multidrug resistance efflux pump
MKFGIRRRKFLLPVILTAVFLLSFVPVPLTALAPCEIVPLDPETVTAPIEGIIQTIPVERNQKIETGQGLIAFVDTTIRGRLEVAERAVEVAAAKERRLQQAAFDDRNARRDLSIAAAELRLAIAERDAALDQLSRTRVMAGRSGLAVFASRKDWEGRPVSMGERVMQIASPDHVQVRIDMPVKDAPVVRDQARVRVYLDSDPLNPLDARLERATYHATPIAGGGLAFVLYAHLGESVPPRIGYRGTAQVFGDDVPLIYYVMRRPLTALRQMVGL